MNLQKPQEKNGGEQRLIGAMACVVTTKAGGGGEGIKEREKERINQKKNTAETERKRLEDNCRKQCQEQTHTHRGTGGRREKKEGGNK